MDKREQLIFTVPADCLDAIQDLLDKRIYYYQLLDQERITQFQANRLNESHAAEMIRLNDAGVSLMLLMLIEGFSFPLRIGAAGAWPAFLDYISRSWNACIETTDGKQIHGTA